MIGIVFGGALGDAEAFGAEGDEAGEGLGDGESVGDAEGERDAEAGAEGEGGISVALEGVENRLED